MRKKNKALTNQSRYKQEGIGKLGRFQNKICGKKHPAMRPFQVSFQHEVCWAAPLLLWGYPSTLVRMDNTVNEMQSGS